MIASEAEDISKNKLDTGTISFSEGGASAPTAYQNSDKASSTTKSAVEKGQLIVRNQEEQQQDINKLSRDTASANDPLKQIFDKDKELDKIETVELVKDIAQQAKNVVNKYDRIQAQNDVDKNKDKLSKAEAEKAYKALSDEEKAKYKSVDDYYEQNKASCYYAAVDTQLKANQEENKNLGTMGGNVSKGIDTATSIAMGIINGDITGGLAGASAPWIAEEIKKQAGDNETARLVAHAILGAVVAELQGNSGLAGGAGAVGGEIAADIIRKTIYAGKDAKDLTEAEKQNISALAQLAAGLATAAGGGDVGDVGTAISSSKNAVENNNLAVATTKVSVEACFKVQACKKVATDVIIEIARWRGLVLTESDININTIDYYINYLDYIPDITSLIMPSSLGSPVTIRDVDVLVKNGVNIAEAEAFLNSLSLEQRRLMNLATSDLMGNKFYEEAVLKTFEEYYPEYQKKKSSNKNTDTANALTGSTSSTAGGSVMPPDDDNDKDKKFKVKKPGVSGKDGAKDVPGRAKEYRPYVGENGKQFAKRLMDKKYGKGNYDNKTNTEFSKIKKWGDRSFMDPK